MKKLTVAMIVLWSIVAVFILILLVGGLLFSRRSTGFGIIGGADGPTAIFSAVSEGDAKLLLDETVDAGGISNLAVSLTSDETRIHPSEDGKFRIVQHGINLDENRILVVEKTGSELRIRRKPSRIQFFNFGFNQKSIVDLYIPSDYSGSLDLDLTSGDVWIDTDLTLADLNVNLTSGNVGSDRSITADHADLELTSGHLDFRTLSTSAFTLETVSGDITIAALSGAGSLKMTSGNIDVGSLQMSGDLSIDITSGNLKMGLSGEPSIEFDGDCTSGTIRTYFETTKTSKHGESRSGTVGSAPYFQIDASITSGNLTINRAE